ncbi:hypothetical protein [Hymenobacter glacieicola]|uniref:Uncharacterized protein n=1 Tax=Hymenobacter glacieicola TaxID=1562124 RepID=A0ABQ1X7L1_9BACT|nr:hypothetical protein [Hymenobacter glacieicola]GGG59940.1 hypothetical protein GCM10011378_39910 [Hymenobacter glacieicola]
MKLFKGFVSAEEDIPCEYPVKSFFNYIANNVKIEDFISVAGFLMPDIVQVDGLILLAENYKIINDNLKNKLNNDNKQIERYVNLFCVSDFYLLAANELSFNHDWQLKQGEIIVKFWKMRLNEIFPELKFDFELSATGLFDEDGICITFSQRV